jgi:hypothetical protein
MKKMLSIALVPVLNMFEQLCVSGRVLLYDIPIFSQYSYKTSNIQLLVWLSDIETTMYVFVLVRRREIISPSGFSDGCCDIR